MSEVSIVAEIRFKAERARMKFVLIYLSLIIFFQTLSIECLSQEDLPKSKMKPTAPLGQAKCVPSKEELARYPGSEKWQICGVYLHGWVGGQSSPETQYEKPMLEKLKGLAVRNQCRIAMPVSPKSYDPDTVRVRSEDGKNVEYSIGGVKNWDKTSIKEVDDLAKQACDGAQMAAEKTLYGFSNGANAVDRLAQKNCGSLGYTGFVPMGQATKPVGAGCKGYVPSRAKIHEVPKDEFLSSTLKFKRAMPDQDERAGDNPAPVRREPARKESIGI